MTKVLFLIHDLGPGGAEKVLVNLVNNMDQRKFDITVLSLFDGGVNKQFLKPHIKQKAIFRRAWPGNSHLMKLLNPKLLHYLFVKERYDIEVAFLEGPSARIVSGCKWPETKLVSWIHTEQKTTKKASASFRSVAEAIACYDRFDKIVGVSEQVCAAFRTSLGLEKKVTVLYNVNESDQIRRNSEENTPIVSGTGTIHWCGVGKLVANKGFDRMLHIQKQLLTDGYNVHLHILGVGPLEEELMTWCRDNGILDHVTFWGYQTNPYKYVKACDLFVCASHTEGFSTASTEALIVGTPVCTVDVSGMKEMLGMHNDYGVITENDERSLYLGMKKLLDSPQLLEHYKRMAQERGRFFSVEETVRAVEDALLDW